MCFVAILFCGTLHIWSPDVHNVAGYNVTVFLIKIHPFLSHAHCLDVVIETGTSVACSHTVREVLCQSPLILQEVVTHGIKLCCLSTYVGENTKFWRKVIGAKFVEERANFSVK